MTKNKLKRVALDYFLAIDVVQERRVIFEERNHDFVLSMKEFAAFKVQKWWQAKKEVSRTRLRLVLKRNRTGKEEKLEH